MSYNKAQLSKFIFGRQVVYVFGKYQSDLFSEVIGSRSRQHKVRLAGVRNVAVARLQLTADDSVKPVSIANR